MHLGSYAPTGNEKDGGTRGPMSPSNSTAAWQSQGKTGCSPVKLGTYQWIMFLSVFGHTLEGAFLSYASHCSVLGVNLSTALFFARAVGDVGGRAVPVYLCPSCPYSSRGLLALLATGSLLPAFVVCMLSASFAAHDHHCARPSSLRQRCVLLSMLVSQVSNNQ